MGGRYSRGGTHSSTALSGSGWRRGGDQSSWVGAAGRGKGGTGHPGLESASSVGLHHAKTRERKVMERGRRGGRGAQMKGFGQLMALNAYKMAGSKRKEN